MLPTIAPGLVWFSRLRIDIEMVRLKRRLVVTDVALPPPLPNVPPLKRRSPVVTVAAAPSFDGPNATVLAIRMFTFTEPGPRPKLRGRIASPGTGFGSSNPYLVALTPGLFGSV